MSYLSNASLKYILSVRTVHLSDGLSIYADIPDTHRAPAHSGSRGYYLPMAHSSMLTLIGGRDKFQQFSGTGFLVLIAMFLQKYPGPAGSG